MSITEILTRFRNNKITDAVKIAFQAANYVEKYKTMKLDYPLISIIMTYYNRIDQATLTFDYFEKFYASKYNFEVIIVDDSSNIKNKLNDLIHKYTFKIKLIELKEKSWINPVVPTNIAINHINPDTYLVIIQNPEILHSGDILLHALKNVNDTNYLTYAIFNSPGFNYNNKLRKLFNNNQHNLYDDFVNKIDYTIFDFDQKYYENKYSDVAKFNFNEKDSYNHYLNIDKPTGRVANEIGIFYPRLMVYKCKGWLNHPVNENRHFHYLSAMTKTTLDRIGGFCNEMKDGLWYDDNDFVNRLEKIVNVYTPDDYNYMGVHMYHDEGTYNHRYIKNHNSLKENNQNIMIQNDTNNIIYCNPKIQVQYEEFINYS